MDSLKLKDVFNTSIRCEDGSVIKMRSLSTPEDFIKEAMLDNEKRDKFLYKAHARIEKYGEGDERAQQFLFAAEACAYSANSHREFAECLKDRDER